MSVIYYRVRHSHKDKTTYVYTKPYELLMIKKGLGDKTFHKIGGFDG